MTERQKAKSLMLLGTASHVGKSLLTAALCRILADEGFRVAPFKAQNMALNSAATPEGLEIGRAQAMQAEAARIAPSVDMNPILIKPSSDTTAQYVVQGKVWRQLSAADYFNHRLQSLFPVVVECYERLAARHEIIVLEGAGSPAEINLKDRDLVNLRMAKAAGATCLLVGDIDRGGVFAALYGTLALLEEDERALIRGWLVNKFRGDQALLTPGLRMFEERVGKPCVGVVPYLSEVGLDEEDGVALEDRRTPARAWRADDLSPIRPLRIGVIALPYLANFTDFDALAAEPSVALAYLTQAADVPQADLLMIPGTKQTLHDLRWLRENGFGEAVLAHWEQHKPLVGVCGGMQMLGRAIKDDGGLEGGGVAAGLGLLPISTSLAAEKVTRRASSRLLSHSLFGQPVLNVEATGYEIHLGATDYERAARPLFELRREGEDAPLSDGAVSADGLVLGTYLHGVFDDDRFRHSFVKAARAACQLSAPPALKNFRAEREARFDRLAAHVRQAIDLPMILRWLEA
jgi:adenosylcobyric acid synthase